MNRYIVSLGTNHQAEENMAAIQQLLLQTFQQVRFVQTEWTLPVGDRYKAPFLNSAVIFSSELPPESLKATLKSFEAQLGRTADQKASGIVPIDLDIIVCNGKIVHPDYNRFSFVKEAVDQLLSSEL